MFSLRSTIVLFGLVFFFFSCKKEASSTGSNSTSPVAPLTEDRSFPQNLIIDSLTLAYIRTEATTNTEMGSAVTNIIMQPALAALSKNPVIFTEVGSDNFATISAQAQDCKMLALRWLYTYTSAPTEAKNYFNKVVSTLLTLANAGNKATTHLPNETSYIGFYEAYSVVRNRMSSADRNTMDNWINGRLFVYRNFAARVNNWETIRMNFLYYIGYMLNNSSVLEYSAGGYNTLLNVNLMAGGRSEDLISRDAFAYHAYNLAFYARILRAKALYEGKDAMISFKNKKNTIGVSVQDMMDYWRPFLVDPVNNPHIEFANTNYAPDKTRSDYNAPYSPSSSIYALEELLFAFPESKGYIQSISGGATRFNRKVSGFLYWPR